MSNKVPVLTIYSDNSVNLFLPVNIKFYENAANLFAAEANRIKEETYIQPTVETSDPNQDLEKESKDPIPGDLANVG